MSEDNKTDEQKAVEDLLKHTPVLQPGAGLPRPRLYDLMADQADTPLTLRSDDYKPLSITSVAYISAELFRPEQADLIKGYMQSLKKTDKADVFALAGGKVKPQDVGIQTPLESDVTHAYAEFELGERESKGNRLYDVGKVAFGAVLALLIWAAKEYWFNG